MFTRAGLAFALQGGSKRLSCIRYYGAKSTWPERFDQHGSWFLLNGDYLT
jgi:hypothetical protein